MSTISSYEGDGSTTQFDITFDYEDADTVKLRVDGVDVTFTFVNPSRVQATTAPADGTLVEVYRETDVSTPAVDFEDGAIVLADDLDAAVRQPRDRVEEIESELAAAIGRVVKVPGGESAVFLPTAEDRANKFLGFDSDGDPVALASTEEEPGLRADLLAGTSSLVGYLSTAAGAVQRTARQKFDEIKTLEDFGAVGYGSFAAAAAGADSTEAIQAAIDWASSGGTTSRAVVVTANFFLTGAITLRNATTLLGSGRQASGFVAADGVTGKWFTAESAQKITLKDLVFYARSITTITHIVDLSTGQAGTEGFVENCWFRNAPEGYGLYVDGNVYYLRNNTFESCLWPLKVLGNGNQLSGVTIMQAGGGPVAPGTPEDAIGLDIAGAFVRGLHVEGTASGALPVRMNGDCHITDAMISNTAGYTFSHLIEVDTTNYVDWSLNAIDLLPNPQTVTISNGIVKAGSTYLGGTNTVSFSGSLIAKSVNAHDGRFLIKDKRLQAFSVRLATTAASVLQHRIGQSGNSQVAGSFTSKINGASVTLQNTPTGGAAFVGGGSVTASGNQFILDVTDQVAADAILMATISFNNTGTALTVWPFLLIVTIGGVAKVRLVLEFRDTSGAAFSLTGMGASKILEVNVLAFLA